MTSRSACAVLCGDLNLLRCFDGSKIRTLVVAWDPTEVTLRSRSCREHAVVAPPTDAEGALNDLLEIGRRYATRPVLYYGTDDLLLLISRNRSWLAPYFAFRMPPAELIEDLVDKGRFSRLAAEKGLPVPPTLVASPKTSFDDVRASVRLPCVFKPSTHIGWLRADVGGDRKPRKALRANTWGEAERCFVAVRGYTDAFVVQSYVPGGEDCIYSYHAYVAGSGETLGEFVGKKIRTYPMNAGVSTFLELVTEPRIAELGRAVVARLGLVGPLKVDFKVHPSTGEAFLLEVNPRFTLWNHLGAVSGVNLPLLAYADLTGASPAPAGEYSTRTRWLSFGNDFRAFYRDYHKTGALSFSEWLRSYRGPMIYDVFSWSDPVPFLAGMVKYARAVAGRRLRLRSGPVAV